MKQITSMLPDALMIAGAAALSYAAWLVHTSAGFAVGGALSLTAGVMIARAGK